jgi:hypothetical protein
MRKGLMGQPDGDREQIAAAAERAAALADSLSRQVDSRACDQAFTLQVVHRIAADLRGIAQQGQRAAEQVTMSLDSLYNVCKQQGVPNGDLQDAIAGLAPVQNPSAYNAPVFMAQLRKVGAALGRGGAQAGN